MVPPPFYLPSSASFADLTACSRHYEATQQQLYITAVHSLSASNPSVMLRFEDDDALPWAIASVVLGPVFLFAGYRLSRFSIFTIAFVLGGGWAAQLMNTLFAQSSLMTAAVYVLAGALCGFIAITVPTPGMFVAGVGGGIELAALCMEILGFDARSGAFGARFTCMALFAGICGTLTILCKKPALIATTSLLGAIALVSGIASFVDVSLFASKDQEESDVSASWWAFVAALIVLIVVGMRVQFKVTGRGKHHEETSDEEPEGSEQISAFDRLQTPNDTKGSRDDKAQRHVGIPIPYM